MSVITYLSAGRRLTARCAWDLVDSAVAAIISQGGCLLRID
jgi:hypothetical protein